MQKYNLTHNARRGSALLIVLGMLAFMIISAVAFSAWMRSSRLPNSYLRRASASRLLAKAALASAIDEIDAAIGDNPHPGLGNRNYSIREEGRVRGTGTSGNRNIWAGRVFIGKNAGNTSDDARNHLIKPSETVSTLTLEGLAYIPPPFVSEARYYSRRSNAATWRKLAFDSGRYAFSAIDVSDCLDVNRLAANVGRSSSPNGRVSLAYVFENDAHKSYDTNPDRWDAFMKDNFRKTSLAEVEVSQGEASGKDIVDSSKVPVTSVADLNLAMYAEGSGVGFESPFSKYVANNGTSFYGGYTPDSSNGRKIRNMAFIADTWQPAGTVTSPSDFDQPQLDLASELNQPFTSGELAKNGKFTAMSIAEKFKPGDATVGQRLLKRLSGVGMVLLKDYLDEDNEPTSLALPQVERTPMVAAVKHNFDGSSLAVKAQTKPGGDETDDSYNAEFIVSGGGAESLNRVIRKVVTYTLDPAKFVQGVEGGFQAVLVYPFRRGTDVSNADSFTVDAHVDFFLASENIGLRTGNRTDVFRDADFGTDAGFTKNDFRSGVFRVAYTSQGCTFNNVTDEQSAMKLVSFTSSGAASSIVSKLNSNQGKLFEVTWQVAQTRTKDPVTGKMSKWTNQGEWRRTDAVSGLTPINAAGAVDPTFANSASLVSYLSGNHDKTATICAAVTVRVKNGDGRTVDLVPAGLMDDKNLNSINNIGAMEEMGNVICGRPGPLLLFKGGSMTLGDTEFDSSPAEVAFNLVPKGAMCADPRWNWAPEHWFQMESVDMNNWLSNCQVGQNGRDRDIFMMTSDSRYLQSVYELACLPRLTNLENYGNDQLRGNMDSLADASFVAFPASFNDTRNRHLMWMTYNPIYRRGAAGYEQHPTQSDARRDPFTFLNLVNRGNGFRVNPFSDMTNVVAAAIANTPTDWWAAGLDPDGQAGVDDSTRKNAKTFNQKHAFSEFNDKAKFAWKDVERISGNIVKAMHSNSMRQNPSLPDGVEQFWQDAFDEKIDWSGDVKGGGDYKEYFAELVNDETGTGNQVLDSLTDDLYDVDRKFLYGYWRECFAAKQQLFLVFVRAEPMMMGGGKVGAVPPQLGARAVALVWRDPAPAQGHENDIKYPHRTRVLFYRQLD